MPELRRRRRGGRHSYGRRPASPPPEQEPEQHAESPLYEVDEGALDEMLGLGPAPAAPGSTRADPATPEHPGDEPPIAEPSWPEAASEPVAAEPSSEPVTPEPASEPVAPEPVAPEPVAPEPASEPVAVRPPRAKAPVPAPRRIEAPRPPTESPSPPGSRGARRAALTDRKRRARRSLAVRGLALMGIVLLALAIAAAATALLSGDERAERASSGSAPALAPEGGDSVVTTLVYGTHEGAGEAAWIVLLTYDVEREEGGVIYIPADTAAEVPGRGPQGLGNSVATGGPALMTVTAENLLDVNVDRYLELSEQDVEAVFSRVGEITVDVPSEVRVAAGEDQERVLFSEGPQRLDASFLSDLLFTVGTEGDDAELGARHLAFWVGLFERFEDDPEALSAALQRAEGALEDSDAAPADTARMLQALAALPPDDRTLALLPVTQVGAGSGELFRVDRDEMAEMLGAVAGPEAGIDEVRVQVLNGNGAPGIGAEVARELVGEGYRVVLSGNALSLDHERTKIVTHDNSPEGLEAARRAQGLLGVGEVEVSSSGQDIVDLTIVVGRDFLRTK